MVRLIKTLKNMLTILHRNPVTGISNRDHFKILVARMSAYDNSSAWRSEFNRIRNKIIQHLLDTLWISVKQGDIGGHILAQFDACLECLRSQAISYLPYQTAQLHLLLLDLKLPQI